VRATSATLPKSVLGSRIRLLSVELLFAHRCLLACERDGLTFGR